MSSAEIIPIQTALVLPADSLTEQFAAYALHKPGLLLLANAIEEEARHAGTIKDGRAIWDVGDSSYRVIAECWIDSRRLAIQVFTPTYNGYVLRDDDLSQFVFDCPPGAKWPVFLKEQHELLKGKRAVEAAVKEREQAAQRERQKAVI